MTNPYDRRQPRDGWPPQGPRRPQPQPRPKPKGFSPARVLFFGVLGLVLGELVKWWQDSLSPLFVSLCTIGVAMIPLLVDYARSSQESTGDSRHAAPYRPRPHRRGGALLVGILLLVTIGGGAAYGISWAVGRFTGNETVIAQRLVAPVTGTADTLSVDVTSVDITDHFTKVGVSAHNDDEMTVLISVWANAQLVDNTGLSLKPVQALAISDDIDVPANGIVVSDVITFDGQLAPEATTATLIFSVLMARGFDFDADSLQVENIPLKPFSE